MAQHKDPRSAYEKRMCLQPRKVAYADPDTAEHAMYTIIRKNREPGRLPSRVYLCACGYWHLTSRPYIPRGAPDQVWDQALARGPLHSIY